MIDDTTELNTSLVVTDKYDFAVRGDITAFITDFEGLAIRHETQLIATRGRFNLFTVLLADSDECRLHSRYLTHLLDPHGAHDCGPLFLRLFLRELERHAPVSDGVNTPPLMLPDKTARETATVFRELPTNKYGNVDILIEFRSGGAIAIENKIYAGDQEGQIAGYSAYLHEKYGSNVGLLYLTLDGRPSHSAKGCNYYRISYREHVLNWIEECLRETYQYVNINQALQQYREVVRQLTGKRLEKQMESILDLLEKRPTIIGYLGEITNAVEKIRSKYLQSFSDKVHDRLKAKGVESVGSLKDSCLVLTYGDLSLGTDLLSLRIEREGSRLFIGVKKAKNEDEFPEGLRGKPQQFRDEMAKHVSGNKSQWWIHWSWLDFPSFDNACLCETLRSGNTTWLDSEADKTVEQAMKYIKAASIAWQLVHGG